MFMYVCFLIRYYYVECTDFMYDSIKILYIYINARVSIIITRYIRYIQLRLNINSYIHYIDMIKEEKKNNTYKYIFTQKHIHTQAKTHIHL